MVEYVQRNWTEVSVHWAGCLVKCGHFGTVKATAGYNSPLYSR